MSDVVRNKESLIPAFCATASSKRCSCAATIYALVCLALSSLLFAGCNPSPQNPGEAAAVSMILKLNGKVEYSGEGEDRHVIKVYLNETNVDDEDLGALEGLPNLRNLFLGNTEIGDDGLVHLGKCVELQTLSLNSTRVTDAGLGSLRTLKKMKTINLKETYVSAAGVSQLQKAIPGATIAH
jgi:hypothetical protein